LGTPFFKTFFSYRVREEVLKIIGGSKHKGEWVRYKILRAILFFKVLGTFEEL